MEKSWCELFVSHREKCNSQLETSKSKFGNYLIADCAKLCREGDIDATCQRLTADDFHYRRAYSPSTSSIPHSHNLISPDVGRKSGDS